MKRILAIILVIISACAVVSSSDVNVRWTHGGSSDTVSGYHIFYGVSPGNYNNSVTTGYVTNTTVSNLPPNTLFYFSGKTIDPFGTETGFGNEVQFLTPGVTNGLPSAVKDFRLVTL